MILCQGVPDKPADVGINVLIEENDNCSTFGNAETSRTYRNSTRHAGLATRLLPKGTNRFSPTALREQRLTQLRKQFHSRFMKELQVQALPIDFCRICRESDSKEGLLSPCQCKGTMASVHVSCLERWLLEADSRSCELCGHHYVIKRNPRYGMLKSLYVWLRYHSPRDMLFDAISFCLFIPFAVLGTYISFLMLRETDESICRTIQLNYSPGWIAGTVATDIYDQTESSGTTDLKAIGMRLAAIGVFSLIVTIDMSFFVWCMIRVQNYADLWYSWWRRSVVLRLVLPPDVLNSNRHPNEEESEESSNDMK